MDFAEMLSMVNVAGADDGRVFTDTTRIDAVRRCLRGAPYRALRAEGIAYIFAHDGFDARRGAVLISCPSRSLLPSALQHALRGRQLSRDVR